MAVNVGNPQDLTGRIKAQREAEVAEEKKQSAKRMSMVTAQAEADKSGTVDLTTSNEAGDVSEDGAVDVARPPRKLRVNTNLEAVTIGHGTSYDFEPGQTYKVDAGVYDYLDERGFVWH